MLGLILTPNSIRISSYLSIIELCNLYSGIPYLNTPPIFSWASNKVTLNPFLAKIIDKVIPAGPAPIIAIVSSCFTQRGDVSIINKWDKTNICLSNGIDMVIELPFF